MCLEEDDSFTITWCVKNFSMCPIEEKEFIQSPGIRVSWFQDSVWSIQLYPKGEDTKDSVGCFLKCNSLGNYKNQVEMQVELCIPPAEALTYKYGFEQGTSFGFDTIILMENLLKEKDLYLPNDTLTVVISFRCLKGEEFNIENEFIYNWDRESRIRKNYSDIRECRVETIIEVHRKNISWPIRKFGSLPVDKRITLPVRSAVKEMPSFYVTLYKDPKGHEKIEIRIKKDSTTGNVFVKCRVSVTSTPKDVSCLTEGVFLFKNDEIWNFPSLINFDDLKGNDYFNNTGDVLHLQFDFAFSIEDKMHITENPLRIETYPPSKTQFPFNAFFQPSSEHSIATLRSKDQTFKVHLGLLQAESEVFKAMFENDMKEKDTGEVDITSVDATTLGRMLAFMYSNDIEDDLPVSDVIKLYSAAHLYQVLSLMTRCSFVLESSLTVSNVYEILRLADLHGDERLLEAAGRFVAVNSHRVLVSKDWKDLMESNGTLTSKVMLKMLIC